MSLYDQYQQPEEAAQSEAILFDEEIGTMWASLEDCGSFEITNESAASGTKSIKISWDKNKGCEWIGFGNSFSNWAGADMSQERFKKAVSFYVRTPHGAVKAIPIVGAMEDVSGGGSYYFFDAGKYLHGLTIDTAWKRMIVPLWHFPVNEEEVDIYSIKQMKFQLEGGGSYYLDDLRIISYTEEEYQKARAEVEEMKPKGTPQQQIYTEGKLTRDAWGVGERKCHTVQETTDSTGNTAIHWEYNATDCSLNQWGMNWNGWYQINFRGIAEKAALQLRVKAQKGSSFVLFLEDYKGHRAELTSAQLGMSDTEDWQWISVPLTAFDLQAKGFVMDQIKQLGCKGIGTGVVDFDDVSITPNKYEK